MFAYNTRGYCQTIYWKNLLNFDFCHLAFYRVLACSGLRCPCIIFDLTNSIRAGVWWCVLLCESRHSDQKCARFECLGKNYPSRNWICNCSSMGSYHHVCRLRLVGFIINIVERTRNELSKWRVFTWMQSNNVTI